MHIKLLYRKVLYVFLSLAIVIANIQTAYASTASVGGWTLIDAAMTGANTVIKAGKAAGSGALKSAVNVAPSAAKLGAKILRGASVAGLAYAVYQIAGDSVDYVLDPENNRIIYTPTPLTERYRVGEATNPNAQYGKTLQEACEKWVAYMNSVRAPDDYYYSGANAAGNYETGDIKCSYKAFNMYGSPRGSLLTKAYDLQGDEQYIPIPTVAQKIIDNAEAGHPESQEAVKAIALEGFAAGEHDAALDAAATPDDAGTGTGTGEGTGTGTGTGTGDGTGTETPPLDLSGIMGILSSILTKIMEMVGLQKETNKVINESVDRAIANDNVKVGQIVAAIEAIEGNTLDGQVINDAVDSVIANDNVKVGDIVAAIEAIEGNTLDGQLINDAIDRVIANDNVNAQAAADAASAAADAASAADSANTAAVTDAIDAQTDAITTTDPTTGEKSLKLPAFCGFAPVVCEYITWVKGEYGSVMEWVKAEPETMPDDPIVVADDPSGIGNIFQDKAEAGYVSFEGQCPNDVLIPVSLMGASQTLTISYTPFCHFASLIRYAVILGAWISGLLIVTGGRSRE